MAPYRLIATDIALALFAGLGNLTMGSVAPVLLGRLLPDSIPGVIAGAVLRLGLAVALLAIGGKLWGAVTG